VSRALVDHCLELLAPQGAARSRRMFGGHGLYVDDLFVAIVFVDRLYLKADEQSQPAFVAAGCEPFVYAGAGKPVTMNYWTAPAEAMESPALMQPWARHAISAALRARAAKPSAAPRKPRATAAKAAPKTRRRSV
jgi:DNA transformation protein